MEAQVEMPVPENQSLEQKIQSLELEVKKLKQNLVEFADAQDRNWQQYMNESFKMSVQLTLIRLVAEDIATGRLRLRPDEELDYGQYQQKLSAIIEREQKEQEEQVEASGDMRASNRDDVDYVFGG